MSFIVIWTTVEEHVLRPADFRDAPEPKSSDAAHTISTRDLLLLLYISSWPPELLPW